MPRLAAPILTIAATLLPPATTAQEAPPAATRSPAVVAIRSALRRATGRPAEAPGPRQADPGVIVERGLVYAKVGGRDLRLDLYRPEAPAPEGRRRPLVVWIHGGGWREGSYASGTPGAMLVRPPRGDYVVASIEYRLSTEAPFPAQVEDCKAAVRWLRAHADRFGIDPDRVGVWGGSAGGHLAALVGLADDSPAWDVGDHLDQSSRVQAVCDFFGPTDFTVIPDTAVQGRSWGLVGTLLGGDVSAKRDLARQASPVVHVDSGDPPFLVAHGTADLIVPVDQSDRLVDRLGRSGVPVEYLRIDGLGHGLLGTPAPGQPTLAETYGRVRAFFDRTIGTPEASPAR